MLCQPVMSTRGNGGILGVVQMLNKKDGEDFGGDDEAALTTCVERLAEELSDKFKGLLQISERMHGRSSNIPIFHQSY